jgi:hypothetical protein
MGFIFDDAWINAYVSFDPRDDTSVRVKAVFLENMAMCHIKLGDKISPCASFDAVAAECLSFARRVAF